MISHYDNENAIARDIIMIYHSVSKLFEEIILFYMFDVCMMILSFSGILSS